MLDLAGLVERDDQFFTRVDHEVLFLRASFLERLPRPQMAGSPDCASTSLIQARKRSGRT